MKKAAFLSRLYYNGGVENHLINLSKLLVKNKFQVFILTRLYNENIRIVKEKDNIPIRIIATPFSRNIKYLKLSTAWAIIFWPLLLGVKKFDVIYTVELSLFTIILKHLLLKKNGRLIWNPVGEVQSIKKQFLLKKKYVKHLDQIVVESEFHRNLLNHNEIKISCIPHMSNSDLLKPLKKNKSGNTINISHLSRLERSKGIITLINVFEQVSNNDDIKLTLYGSGRHKDEALEIIKQKKLEDKIIVKEGWETVEQLNSILNSTDIVILLSETEGLPLILIESMASGTPFFATDVGAIKLLAQSNPDVAVVSNEFDVLVKELKNFLIRYRNGEIKAERLVKYYELNFSFYVISNQWKSIFIMKDCI